MKKPISRVLEFDSPLKNKMILVVDDEVDVLETVAQQLDMCLVHKASDYDTALECLPSHTYDIVFLDIMGVTCLELLKKAVSRGFSTVMVTAYALSPESLTQIMREGLNMVSGPYFSLRFCHPVAESRYDLEGMEAFSET